MLKHEYKKDRTIVKIINMIKVLFFFLETYARAFLINFNHSPFFNFVYIKILHHIYEMLMKWILQIKKFTLK